MTHGSLLSNQYFTESIRAFIFFPPIFAPPILFWPQGLSSLSDKAPKEKPT